MWFSSVQVLFGFFWLLRVATATTNAKKCSNHSPQDQNVPLINTPLGPILGSTLKSRLGRTIYAFRGIRYGKAPVGELRFKPPQPADPWSGTYNATEDGPRCPQIGSEPISEDCLFLNVYSPKLPRHGSKSRPKLPVIIYLHPGGFYANSGRSTRSGPQYFLDQDIVLVTLNFRLGTLGFLSLGKESPGNNGLRDQNLAMKWVQKNIAAFGGDPDSVTLYGYSAGSRSVTLHMISPMSRGLFHKAIISSGSALGIWKFPNTQLDLARKQAQIAGCNRTETTQEIYECLKQVPAEDFGKSLPQFFTFGSNPVLVWSPVIENDYGQERFLADNPIKLVKEGKAMDIPVLAGVTKDEFAYLAIPLVQNSTQLNELSENWETLAPLCFAYESGTSKSKEVSAKARKFYVGEGPLTNASLSGLENIYYDSIEGFPVTRTARLFASINSKKVYFYLFTYQGRYSHYYMPGTNNTQPYGVVHHDDLIYLMYNSVRFPFFQSDDPETQMVEKLTTLWANFAKTGNPTPEISKKLDNLRWEPYSKATDKVLYIDTKLEFRDRPNSERYNFWNNQFPVSEQLL